MEVQVSSGQPQGQGLRVQQNWAWRKPSWGRSPLIHHRAARTYAGLGNSALLEGTNRTLCTRTQEKGEVTPQETDPGLPASVQECPVEAWVGGGLLQGWGLPVAVHAWDVLKVTSIITSTIVWPQVNSRERTQPRHQQKVGLKIH